MTRYIVQTASANMPSSCWGQYGRVAVLEIDPATCPEGGPRMISDHARGVVRVVETWERLHVGTTERCAFERALAEARGLAVKLNSENRAVEMLAELGFSGPRQEDRSAKLAAVLQDHPEARLEQCSDENTGRRYGLAKCRRGRATKIGSTTYQYQLWAVW